MNEYNATLISCIVIMEK